MTGTALGDLDPVPRESTAALVAIRLRAAIADSVLAPGSQLGEAALAAAMGVSRGPLREAMQRLVQEGLLRSEPHRGLFVVELGARDVRDIYAARTAVETAAVRAIMAGSPQSAARALQQVQTEMAAAARAEDETALAAADLRFHEVLVAASGSPRLIRMAATLLTETRMCLAALRAGAQTPDERAAEHAGIVDAISRGSLRQALDLLTEHMDAAVDQLAPSHR